MDTESDTESAPSPVALTISTLQRRLKELERARATAQADVEVYVAYLATRRDDLGRIERERVDVTRALEILQAAE